MSRPSAGDPAVRVRHAEVRFGQRVLWSDLNLSVEPGEFLAVLGPNGAGKSTLLNVLLGLQPLTAGSAEVAGRPVRRGSSQVGYVPQQRAFDPDVPIRGRDLVGLGLDGHRFGFTRHRRARRARIDQALSAVGASDYADAPVGRLSGGEQQRLRIAQALLSEPQVLLCDEPLLSLDLSHQQAVSALIDERRRLADTAVVFVTHEINPILSMVDRVLYLVGGKWAIGTPAEVLTSQRLTALYAAPVEVLHVHGRIVVVGGGEAAPTELHPHHHHADGEH